MSIAIMCSGGDACGMNPAIKTFVDNCFEKNITPYLVYDGFEGLIKGDIKKATYKDTAGIIHLGGTVIRTSRSKEFFEFKYRKIAYENLQKYNINKIIVLGGDGSFNALDIFAHEFELSFIGIPSTIDNDIYLSDYSLGVDTSLNVIKDALDDIRDTSSSFKRAFVVETMGRDSGYLACVSAITSGAEICLIPEKELDLQSLKIKLKKQIKEGRSYLLAIVAEGSNQTKKLALWIEHELDMETRTMVLGHIQRGGTPSVYDRLMAVKFVTLAINKILTKNICKEVVIYKNGIFTFKNISEVTKNKKTLDKSLLDLIQSKVK